METVTHMKNSLSDYIAGRLCYSETGEVFCSNFQSELQLVLCRAKSVATIKQALTQAYTIKATVSLDWQSQLIAKHLTRLNIEFDPTEDWITSFDEELFLIIYQVDDGEYIKAKDKQFGYQLMQADNLVSTLTKHSLSYTRSIDEFFYTCCLATGYKLLIEILSLSEGQSGDYQVGDLAGTHGWSSFREMFEVLNVCSDWLVMRNAEFLPDDFWGNDKDVDVLCSELPLFTLAANAKKKGNGEANYQVQVADKWVDVDIHIVGDNYYDASWQRDMLKTKVVNDDVPRLCPEHDFYSLFYHARVHKPQVKAVYIERLRSMAEQLSIQYPPQALQNNRESAQFIDAFLSNNQYFITYPNDYACYESLNLAVLNKSTQVSNQHVPMSFVIRKNAHALFIWGCKLAPRGLKDTIKRLM